MTPDKGSDGVSENVSKWKNGDANLFVTTIANKTVTFLVHLSQGWIHLSAVSDASHIIFIISV